MIPHTILKMPQASLTAILSTENKRTIESNRMISVI